MARRLADGKMLHNMITEFEEILFPPTSKSGLGRNVTARQKALHCVATPISEGQTASNQAKGGEGGVEQH